MSVFNNLAYEINSTYSATFKNPVTVPSDKITT